MSIIERMLLRDLLRTFFIALLGINSLLILEPLIRFSKKASGVSIGLLYMARTAFLIQPKMLVFSLPLALMIGLISTYGRLNIDNELIVLRASGARIKDIFRPALVVIFSVLIISSGCAHWLGPTANKAMRLTLNEIIRTSLLGSVEPEVFFQNIKGLTLFVRGKEGKGTLKGIFLFQDTEPPRIITAERARWIKGATGYILLEKGHIFIPEGGEIMDISFRQYEMSIPIPEEIIGLSRESMSDRELINRFRTSGRRIFIVELLRRFSLSVINLPLGLIALVFSVRQGHGVRMKGFIFTVILYGAYYAVLLLFENLTLSNAGNPIITLLPLLVLTIGALYLYGRFNE